jgi:preprotein translocase subunit YajC
LVRYYYSMKELKKYFSQGETGILMILMFLVAGLFGYFLLNEPSYFEKSQQVVEDVKINNQIITRSSFNRGIIKLDGNYFVLCNQMVFPKNENDTSLILRHRYENNPIKLPVEICDLPVPYNIWKSEKNDTIFIKLNSDTLITVLNEIREF